MRDLITSTGRVARRGETKTGFSISVNDHETIAALAKAIAGEIVTHWAASTNPPVRVVYEPLADVVEIGSLVIDTKGYDVTDDGVPVTLKPREYALLLALARGAGHAFTREKLLEVSHPIRKTYLGGPQQYPDSFISETNPNALGWGAYETYDGIDLSFGGVPASVRKAGRAFNDPNPPYPCAVDSQNYCSVNAGSYASGQCYAGTNPIKGTPFYIYGSTTTYKIYHRSDVYRFVENASYTKTVFSDGQDPPGCTISYKWTPAEPKQQFSDANLP